MQTTEGTPLPITALTQAIRLEICAVVLILRIIKRLEVAAFILTCTLVLDQVGPGNISVVSPPVPHYQAAQAPFAGAPEAHQQYEDAPPDYSEGSTASAFSEGAVRRGEQGLQPGFDQSGKL